MSTAATDSPPSVEGESLTQGLVRLIRGRRVTQPDLEQAALFTLDAVANAVAGRNSEPGRILTQWRGAANTPPDTGRQAFLMGALTHILETDDLHRDSVVHPGCVVVPAAWAMAEHRGTEDGRELLTAILHGFEAACRVGMAVGPAHYRIWHNTATCGPFGAAMAAARLLGLDEDQAVHSLGNAGSQAAGLWQFLETGAMTKHLHAGHAAEAGITAAELAALGFTGAPAILEGEKGFFAAACPDADPDAVLRNPEEPWQLTRTSIKPWPSCRHTHPVIDAALGLQAELESGNVRPDDIAAIQVGTYRAALDVCDRPAPATDYDAKFSLQHCVAIGLSHEEIGFEAFGAAARAKIAELASRVELALAEPYASAYPNAWGSSVQVRLRDGTKLTAARDHALGDPEAPLSREQLIDKALGLFRHGGIDEPAGLVQAVLRLAEGGKPPALPLGPLR